MPGIRLRHYNKTGLCEKITDTPLAEGWRLPSVLNRGRIVAVNARRLPLDELKLKSFSKTLEIFKPLLHNIPLQAVLNGNADGRIFCDSSAVPSCAFAWTPWGYFYLAGAEPTVAFWAELHTLLEDVLLPDSSRLGEPEPVFFVAPEFWPQHPGLHFEGRDWLKIYRRSFTLDRAAFMAAYQNWPELMPPGFRLLRVDADLVAQLGDKLSDDILATWRSLDEFFEKGVGFCLFQGDALASVCVAAFVGDATVEVGVSTQEAYRRRGLATLTTAALVDYCLAHNLAANWECWWDNEASSALAKKLGYLPGLDHAVFLLLLSEEVHVAT